MSKARNIAALNTVEVGATTDQTKSDVDALGIAATSVTGAQASAISANTSKTGITSAQASAITANTAKITYPSADSSKLSAVEVGATADQTKADIDALGIAATSVTGSQATAITAALPKAGGTMTGDTYHGDNVKAKFGASNDLEIFHDSANSVIQDVGTGSLILQTDGTQVSLQSTTEYFLTAAKDGAVTAYHNGAAKLATTSTGVDISGTVTADGLTLGDNDKAKFGTGGDLEIYHDAGGSSYINETGSGSLYIQASNLFLKREGGAESFIECTTNGDVALFHDGLEKLATTSTGVGISGSVICDVVTTDAATLTAIAQSKSVTAVDVFVYDTSKDSDGGAWRKRTQGTSWYNETLNTSTRGSRKEFPAVAVIVAESNKVTIYDGDDPSMPMWMVFNSATWQLGIPTAVEAGALKATSALNGLIIFGSAAAGSGGITRVGFIDDCGQLLSGTGWAYTFEKVAILERNTKFITVYPPYASDPQSMVHFAVNDIAMTVLPNAPIDSTTGLPIPTIAVATNGGVSVIKDDGSVVDIVITQTYKGAGKVEFLADNRIAFTAQQSGGDQDYYHYNIAHIPTTDLSNSYWQSYPDSELVNYAYGYYSSGPWLAAGPFGQPTYAISNNVVGGYRGLGVLKEDKSNTIQGSVAYITSDYNTGYMVGDIKLAALSDTDATDVVGSELVTTLDFTNFITDDATVLAIEANGDLTVNNGNTVSNTFATSPALPFILGEKYTACIEGTGSGAGVGFYAGTEGGPNGYLFSRSITFTANVTSGTIRIFRYSGHTGTGTLTGISIRLADTDRSVNANGLQVHGTITKTPVATGADLVGYSGFSASNYLEQPYNSDLDFGTGDFSIMGWWSTSTTASQIGLFRSDGDASSYGTGALFHIELSGTFKALIAGAGYVNAEVVSYPAASFATGGMRFVVIARASGTLNMYIDGILVSSVASDNTMTNTSARLKVGERDYASRPWQGDIALVRISATAPSAQQIKDIYEAEKPLFQDNAQATLYGTSDAVTALAHDSDTNLLHVGTSSGRSVFQGLQRVSNTTTAVGSAISASNNLVVED